MGNNCSFLAHSEKMNQKRGATPKAPLTSLTFVTTRPNEQDSMALAAPKVQRGMQTENCRNRQFSVGFGKPGHGLNF